MIMELIDIKKSSATRIAYASEANCKAMKHSQEENYLGKVHFQTRAELNKLMRAWSQLLIGEDHSKRDHGCTGHDELTSILENYVCTSIPRRDRKVTALQYK